jgi:hypothetical protein
MTMCETCSPGWDPRDQRPDPLELAEQAAIDKAAAARVAEQEAATAAAGGYVPDTTTKLVAGSIAFTLGMVGLEVNVAWVRDRTYRLNAPWGRQVDADQVRGLLGHGYEVADHDGNVWVRATDTHPLVALEPR